jgi:4-alpha-glucanotransferase
MQGRGLVRYLSIDVDTLVFPLEYKLVLLDDTHPDVIFWEEGENRRLNTLEDANPFADGFLVCCPPFREADALKLIGTAVPLFSLRTERSAGVGDFGDLFSLIDWAVETGQRIIQLLPLNDTSTTLIPSDSYPYKITSVNALHPLYLSLQRLGSIRNAALSARYAAESSRLELLPQIDYVAALRLKLDYFADYLTEHPELADEPAFHAFLTENAEWLRPYAHYRYLTETYGSADFSLWKEDSRFDPHRTESWCVAESAAFLRTALMQYILHTQLFEAATYARSQHIFLKGDLPIGVHPHSVEVWTHPQYFSLKWQTGAPPDPFSRTGQNWGFPIYRWEAMQDDGFLWWKRRLARLACYFDALRIDHVLGFFRIWAIPEDSSDGCNGVFVPAIPFSADEICAYGFPFDPALHADGIVFRPDDMLSGHYHPLIAARDTERYARFTAQEREAYDRLHTRFFWGRHDELWRNTALMRLTPLLADTPMLICAEDLGMLPATLPDVMQCLQLLSLAIERMPRTSDTDFFPLEQAPFLSVCTPSTHDMSPLRLWWIENRAEVARYCRQVLGMEAEPPSDCSPDIVRRILLRQIQSPAMVTIIAIQDWLALSERLRHPDPAAERINRPDDPNNYWCYRLHVPLSALTDLSLFADLGIRK